MSCGPGRFGDLLVPDTLYGLDVSAACAEHDRHYEAGGTDEQRDVADWLFYQHMLAIIDDGSWFPLLRWLRARRARLYYLAVREFGGDSWTR